MYFKEQFEVVKVTEGVSKNKSGRILIETSINGLVYRTEILLDGRLIDAKEVDCKDLSELDNGNIVFEERYLSSHKIFEEVYLAKKSFKRVLSNDGQYIDGEEECIVNTYLADDIIKTEVLLDGNEIDSNQFSVDKKILNDENALKAKYTSSHKDFVTKYIKVLKFPANTFLNPLLKKLPLYKKNPLYAFYFFLAIVVFVLWILSLILCGKAMKKIVVKIAGKEAGFIVKDLQKSMCLKSMLADEDGEVGADGVAKNECNKSLIYRGEFQIMPESVLFKNTLEIRPIYIKNNLPNDLIIRMTKREILGINDPTITGDMIVNIISPTTIYVKPSEISSFEFKLEDSFFRANILPSGEYSGNLVFEILGLKNNQTEVMTIPFKFNIAPTEEAQ